MGLPRKLKISVEDDARLEKVFQATTPLWVIISFVLFFIILLLICGALIMAFSPAKTLLPGYIATDERLETENRFMQIDSLMEVNEINMAYLDNLKRIMKDSLESGFSSSSFSSSRAKWPIDSLLDTSPEEIEFINSLSERERLTSTLNASKYLDRVDFSPINNECEITLASRESLKAEFVMSKDADVGSIADGIVVSIDFSPDKGGTGSIMIQHPGGFLSRYSNLAASFVSPGDHVATGEVIAAPKKDINEFPQGVFLEMWHNGNRLIPSDFISPVSSNFSATPVVDKDIGRGRD